MNNPLDVKHLLGTDETGGPLEPWLVRGAITMIDEHLSGLDRKPLALEFGSGSGTPWFYARCGFVASVEHHAGWAERVADVTREVVDSKDRACGVIHRKDLCEEYEHVARMYADGLFDLVLVDGRRRRRCINEAFRTVRPGGLLVLDNSERSYYQPAIDLLDGAGWERCDFENSLWKTTIWRRPVAGGAIGGKAVS